MPRTGDSEPETGQRGGYRRLQVGKPQRARPDPIERLRTDHGDATVEVYGEATLQALDERGSGPKPSEGGELLEDVRPLATVDLSKFQPVEADLGVLDDPVDRLKVSAEDVDGEQFLEARYVYEAFEQNAVLLTRAIDDDE